jgi:hypothetical protein
MPRKSAPKRKPPSRSAKSKAPPKPGMRNLEKEYARFLETSRNAGTSEEPKDFDKSPRR